MKGYLITLWIGLVVVSELLFFAGYKLTTKWWLPPIKNEMDEEYTGILMAMLMGAIFALCVTAIPMLLNINSRFRENPIRRFFSFFLLPIILMILDVSARECTSAEIILVASFTVPFFTCLTITYILFSGHLKKNETNK